MTEKGKPILAYVFGWVGGLIILLGFPESSKNTKIHAAQSIIISGVFTIVFIIYGLLPIYSLLLSTALRGLYIVLMILGIIKAAKEDENPKLPIVSDIAESLFGSTINKAQ